MNIETLADHLEGIKRDANRKPHIETIDKAAVSAGLSFSGFILGHRAVPSKTGVKFKTHYREEEKNEWTRLAEAILESGWDADGLDNPEEIIRLLRVQVVNNSPLTEFVKVKNWWGLVRQKWGDWVVDTGRDAA